MPIYEFYCPTNNKVYSFFARSLAQGRMIPKCPDDPSLPMEKLVSKFAVTGRHKNGDSGGEGPDLDDPRVAAAMQEMEREMASLDDDNPDPRQLGRLMRRFSELAPEGIPEGGEELIRRLEAGEDPEKLEEQFGGLFDEEGTNFGEGNESVLNKARRRLRVPKRDPKLYEMADYI